MLALARSVPPSKFTKPVPEPLVSEPVTSVPPVSRLTVPIEPPADEPSETMLTLATAEPAPPPTVRIPREAPFWPTRIVSSG